MRASRRPFSYLGTEVDRCPYCRMTYDAIARCRTMSGHCETTPEHLVQHEADLARRDKDKARLAASRQKP